MGSVTRTQWIAFAAAVASLFLGWRVYRWGVEKGDPRLSIARQIAREADPRRDVLITPDEATHVIAAVRPLPALHGTPALDDLSGIRRVYVVALAESGLAPFFARFGTPTRELGSSAMRWDVAADLATIRWDLSQALEQGAVDARRVGGVHDGPCPRLGNTLICNGEGWNHVRFEPHTFLGTHVPCVFAHPQADGRLELDAGRFAPGAVLVGMVGMDDASYYPTGTQVDCRVNIAFDGGATLERVLVAPNRRGVTPYRIDLGRRAGTIRFSITTRNAGARQFCFTARVTDRST